MPNRYKSNLDYMMHLLNISGKEMSDAIYVDVSLISKWRNKKRKLNSKSPYFDQLVLYILNVDKENQYLKLRNFFSNEDLEIKTVIDLKSYLELFLMNDTSNIENSPLSITLTSDQESDIYDYKIRVYKDNFGRREAVIKFLDNILSMNTPQELLLISQEDMTWMLEDTEFLKEWNEKFSKIINRKHHIKIIHFVDRDVQDISSIIKYWVPLYSNRNIDSYYYSKFNDENIKTTLFIIKDKLAVFGINYKNNQAKRYTALYGDSASLELYENMFNNYLIDSKPLVMKFASNKISEFLLALNKEYKKLSSINYFSHMPTMMHMTPNHLKEILESNQVDKNKIDEIMAFHQNFRDVKFKSTRIIYNMSSMNHLLTSKTIIHNELSFLAEKEIYIGIEMNLELLEEFSNTLNNDTSIEMVFVDFHESHLNLPINFAVSQDNFSISYSPMNMQELNFAEEATTVAAFEHFFESIWSSIPRIKKDKNQTIKTINAVMNSIK
ncbi:MAG: hypothetical protein JW702_08565 [Clostridiales bacterium]|nr:hypothetical protein [Clostridiales bacterium]